MRTAVKYSLIDSESLSDPPGKRPRPTSLTWACYTSSIFLCLAGCLAIFVPVVYMYVVLPYRHSGVKDHIASSEPQVQTHCGPVKGVSEDGVYIFKGIPYAVPPVGDRRWTRPEKLSRDRGTCWSEPVFNATAFGKTCSQYVHSLRSAIGSEDCLFLNVWTPSLDPGARLPVIFWIHGGYLLAMNGHYPGYSPNPELVKDTDAVFVSFNYRLGPFGFLTLDVLSKASPDGRSGNYGLMDQILALEWVRDNIRNFGGDPGKVTLLGQSSGGTSIFALLASPLAAGLFHRAWAASGSPTMNKTMQQASQDNLVFLNTTGCGDVTCLRGLSPLELLRSTPWYVFPYWMMDDLLELPEKGRLDGALIVVDDYVLPDSLTESWEKGLANDVPVVITNTAQEADIHPNDINIGNWTWADYKQEVRNRLSPFGPGIAERAIQLYPPGDDHTPELMYTSMITDLRSSCPSDVISDIAAKSFSSPVYRAVINALPSTPFSMDGEFTCKYAFHGFDSIALFGTFTSFGLYPSASDLEFQKVLRQMIVNFAHDGRLDVPDRKPRQGRRSVALVSDVISVADDYIKDRCEFWMSNGFYLYAWIN